MEVKVTRNDHGTYDVISIPAPIFDVKTEEPKRNDRGVIIFTQEEILKSDFEDEDSAIEWAEENGHGIVG